MIYHAYCTSQNPDMLRELIQGLHEDVRRDTIDNYDYMDLKELKESYLAHTAGGDLITDCRRERIIPY